MDFDDAITMAITQGNHRYGNILSVAEKTCKMSRATFDKHLKQLQNDNYIKRNINKKIIEYKINQKKIHEILEFKVDEKLNDLIKNNEKALEFKGQIFLRQDAEQHLEETIQNLNQHIETCFLNQRLLMVLMNLKKTSKTLRKKYRNEFEKYEISFKQTLELMEKISPDIRENYEQFLLVNIHNENKSDIEKTKKFKGTSLLKKYIKNHKKFID